MFNPNKAGLLKVVFFWGVSFWPPVFIFHEELLQYQYYFMQLLSNLFKVGWILKSADIVCYMLTSLFFCYKETSKNKKNWCK